MILVDDEPLAREGMRQLLAEHPEVEVVGEAGSVAAATELIHRVSPDAVFLDIRMPRADGFSLLNMDGPVPKVIFVTAYSDHAVRAFEVQAVDYLLKPVHPARLADALRRLKTALGYAIEEPSPFSRKDRLCLRTPERTVIAPLSEVVALEAEGDFTRFHLLGEPPLLIGHVLRSYEQSLPNPPFVRIGRSLMISLEQVLRVDRASRDEAQLWMRGLKEPFTLGRRARLRLQELGL